jgi:hypothetical protein
VLTGFDGIADRIREVVLGLIAIPPPLLLWPWRDNEDRTPAAPSISVPCMPSFSRAFEGWFFGAICLACVPRGHPCRSRF